MMVGEPIKTNYTGFMQAYLVEARSIAGLSGSPVFVMRGPELTMIEVMASLQGKGVPHQNIALLGLM